MDSFQCNTQAHFVQGGIRCDECTAVQGLVYTVQCAITALSAADEDTMLATVIYACMLVNTTLHCHTRTELSGLTHVIAG